MKSKDIKQSELDALIERLEKHDKSLEGVEEKLDTFLSRKYLFKIGATRVVSSALGATIGIAFVIFGIRWMITNVQIPALVEFLEAILEVIPSS